MNAPGPPARVVVKELNVSFFTPWRARCGISDYSHQVVAALQEQPDIAQVRIVEAPENAARGGSLQALRHFAADTRRFRALGAQMNEGNTGAAADVAHVQHQYFFFGGVAPHKNHAHAFLDAVRVPLVMTVHEIALPDATAPAVQRSALALANRLNFLHPAIRQFIVHTEADRQRLAAFSIPPERLQVVTHGVPSAAPLPDSDSARHALGLEGKRVVTLFGFLAAKKGHRLALEALHELPSDVLLLFAGDQHPDDHTEYVPALRAEIQAQGLAERVRITGYLPEEQIPCVMAATDVGIAPFTHSSGSGSLANLLAYARPIVASDIPPHREIARETPACLALFPAASASALAAQIRAVLDDSAQRAALQEAARAYAARHSYAAMAAETVRIYRLACGEGG